ncbi:transcriptional regulator, HxlR family [Filimonas lacunae]|uniref:Transcriptional regulator, HxlR family n=1 Tax=Filimonas lacunae TaxID=477680 RepID=A0A1N7PSZ3_9BACT|nr:helix-turn-helix domain-containing protein [Filimonas lacunae]SIT13728.1 transcriptional regulator, HxlR family [Filimonas lacunae]
MITEKLSGAECTKRLMAVRDALDVINGKWKIQIIIALWEGNTRFKDIERHIPKITARMLSKELKDLECHQLVKRTVYDTLPVSVEYTATAHASTLRPVIEELNAWGTLHRKKILDKQQVPA